MKKKNADWNYETCIEESKKYKSRTEFQKGSNGAYLAALKNGWLDEYTWLKRPESSKKMLNCVKFIMS